MAFEDDKHKQKVKEITELWRHIEELSIFAKEYDIDDIFQDNDGKVLQQLVYMNFDNLDGREGNDGIDENGVEWEMKSVNIEKTKSISTNHHLNLKILEKYRLVPWSFAVYKNTDLQSIYAISPIMLEKEYFKVWENQIVTQNIELNNPKINLEFVIKNGTKVYSKEEGIICNPISVYDEELKRKNIEHDFSTSIKRDIEDIIKEINEFTKNLHQDILINSIKYNKKDEKEYLIGNKAFLRIRQNKDSAIIYLSGINPDEHDLVSEIKQGKKKYSEYSCQYKQQNKKEDLSEIKELINKSFKTLNGIY